MDVLFTGNLKIVSSSFFAHIGKEYRCVVFGKKEELGIKGKNIVSYHREGEADEEIASVFTAFDFGTVLYFSCTLDGNKKVFDELEKLENILYLCRKNLVKNFIYVTSNDLFGEAKDDGLKTSHFILKDACESLCRNYSDKFGIFVQILKVPYLYQLECGRNWLSRWLSSAMADKKVKFPGEKSFRTDFLCDEDLGELLGRILDEPADDKFICMDICGRNGCTFEELGELFRGQIEGCSIEYAAGRECVPGYQADERARKEYGWYPEHLIKDDIAEILASIVPERKRTGRVFAQSWRNAGIARRISIILEVFSTVFVAEILNLWTQNNVIVNFIDFRLVCVVLMGAMNGLNAGIVSALLCSVGYVFTRGGTQWQVIFYNVQNWLPFACYFLLGAILGYTRDRHLDEVRYAKEEYEILEGKYVFLNGLYRNVLESKESYNSQIIGYKDSFGKLYSVVKKLGATMPEQVYFEAVNVLEEMLGNSYVAIYSMSNESSYARLAVCSKNCKRELGKSLKVTDYPALLEALKNDTIFINKDALPDYPAYATPVFRDEKLVGMILLLHADYKQMNTEFSNKFAIVAGLIRDSLVRAGEYFERGGERLTDTCIMEAGHFRELLAVKKQMRQKQYLDYILLRIVRDGKSLKELSDTISGIVRANDVLGLGEDGNLYLLMSQTQEADMGIVEERMNKKQISFELVEG